MTTIEYRVSVYETEDKEKVISRVRYNSDLDYWNGTCRSYGEDGNHRGITKLKDGRYVIIYANDDCSFKDYGLIVSPAKALEEILKSGNEHLLKTKKYKGLKELYQSTKDIEKVLLEEEI